MICPNCGANIADNAAASRPAFSEDYIPEEYRPIGMWGYFGYELLFSIPFVGFIVLIVMCFAPTNKNVKNFARSYFCYMIIVLIVLAILLLTVGLAAGSEYLNGF